MASESPIRLRQLLAPSFSDRTKSRGREYFRAGWVKIDLATEDHIVAEVRGSKSYVVEIMILDEGVQISCECPYYTDFSEPCKHAWATVLAADEAGVLQLDESAPSRVLLDMGVPPDSDETSIDQSGDSARTNGRDKLWRVRLDVVGMTLGTPRERRREWPDERILYYVIDLDASRQSRQIVLGLAARDTRTAGELGPLRDIKVARTQVDSIPDPLDRRLVATLVGAPDTNQFEAYGRFMAGDQLHGRFFLHGALQGVLMPEICQTGRCLLRDRYNGVDEARPLRWEDGPPWELAMIVRHHDANGSHGEGFNAAVELRRPDGSAPAERPLAVFDGIALFSDHLAPFGGQASAAWLVLLNSAPLEVPHDEAGAFIERLIAMSPRPRLELPDELHFEEVRPEPRPHVDIVPERGQWRQQPPLLANLSFDYDGLRIMADEPAPAAYDRRARRLVLRNPEAEKRALQRMRQAGFRAAMYRRTEGTFEIAERLLPDAVRVLVQDGWEVAAEGRSYRKAGALAMHVKSGIDWFELDGAADFGEMSVGLPEILSALRRGESMVRLGDGSYGVLPEEWLEQLAPMTRFGAGDPKGLRFRRSQIGVLDALLADRADVEVDEIFDRLRRDLAHFRGVEPLDPPSTFEGSLREYQREALGWLAFLRRFGFGGCLADDMGLGKTVMALAMLEGRRVARRQGIDAAAVDESVGQEGGDPPSRGPSLVVVPKSLVFNWKREAARFTPEMRVLDHTGTQRSDEPGPLLEYDVILTTYGTLRRDIRMLCTIDFDYVILDEAQAIKNAASESAKAARALRGDHLLAMSGTPVENHLGELWSLFEFLNPGMLGASSAFRAGRNETGMPDEDVRQMLARALRPFILRRTKEQVASDLPQKLEQTLVCELEGSQRRTYDELVRHYRASLLGIVAEQGIARSKIQILEALLRLRQAACHPALLDGRTGNSESAKFQILFEMLDDVLGAGKKALIFSQFTTLLGLLGEELRERGIVYEYLDGRTRDRQRRVDRFQEDPDCPLFLISLKAGGVGLNLTAAEYVFLLDPWWNPAVEAQAIDRSHRIGQQQRVFAYRIVARDTIEEKVLELQQRKRELADAIISADNSLIRGIDRDDLELLLS
ncbi:MAG TPA: SNF2-related protein [Candidatus Kapabacteria bacterium]|nr:SNF2-related protein [Candidatus Kapabacteria bacterium]